MKTDYFQIMLSNLEPCHPTYKGNINELYHLSVVVHLIKTVQYGREHKWDNNIPVDNISEELKIVCDRLADFLEQNEQVETPFEIDFLQVCRDFHADVRSIDADMIPQCKEGQCRTSSCILPLISPTSKRISTKLFKSIPKGTKYLKYYSSIWTGQRAKRKSHLAFIVVAWILVLLGASTIKTGYGSLYKRLKNESSLFHWFLIGVTTREALEAIKQNFSAVQFLPAAKVSNTWFLVAFFKCLATPINISRNQSLEIVSACWRTWIHRL